MKTETGEGLMEAILTRENMTRALKAVERNKGAAGVDKMTIAGLRSWLKENWPEVKR
jgi:retron-type reverse transcriptase